MARRRNKIAFPRVNSKTVIMGGGVNEAATSLELKPGELFACLNYEEIDGVYHGYSSVEGLEKFDGKPSPSEVPIQLLQDNGNDKNTLFLLESLTNADIADKSLSSFPIDAGNAFFDSSRAKFGNGSWKMTDMSTGFTVDQTVDGINFDEDQWTLDGWFQFTDDTQDVTIFEKQDVIKVVIESTIFKVYVSTDIAGVYGKTITIPILKSNRWNEFRVVRDGDAIYAGANGFMVNPVSLAGEVIASNTNPLQIGVPATSSGTYFIESIRISAKQLAVQEYNYEETLPYSDANYSVLNTDDLAREAARGDIDPVPGEGPIRGVYVFEEDAYVVRDKTGGAYGGIYKETPTGWEEILTIGLYGAEYDTGSLVDTDQGDTFTTDAGATGTLVEIVLTTGNPIAGTGVGIILCTVLTGTLSTGDIITADTSGNTATFTTDGMARDVGGGHPANFVESRFAYFPASDPNSNLFYFTSGTTGVFASNGTNIYHISGPLDVDKIPVTLAEFSDRLWIAYEDGHVFYSAPGEPDNFSAEFGAGEIYLGGDITNLVNLPGGALAVIMKSKITIIKQVGSATAPTDYYFATEDFSKRSGGYFNTAHRILGDVYFADDRGITSMEAVDTYSDFEVGAIQKRAQITYQGEKASISGAIVHRAKNQYRLFFNNTTETKAIFYTFTDKALKGATLVTYPKAFTCFAEGEDTMQNVKIMAGSEDGYVYRLDWGVSFDGDEIPTKLSTAFYHYATPRLWKRFYNVQFEISADDNMIFNVKPEFNYRSTVMASALTTVPEITGKGGIWGQDRWGYFIWSGSAVNVIRVYLNGYGFNMSVSLATSDKYRASHTVHNMITDYANGNRQM